MFPETEVYRESAGYRPGDKAVLAETPFAKIGMTVCYDVRFPHLYRRLAQAGAQIITVPAAFNHITGAAHWHVSCCGHARLKPDVSCWPLHRPASIPKQTARDATPTAIRWRLRLWGEILADAGTEPGVTFVDLDLAVTRARARVLSLVA